MRASMRSFMVALVGLGAIAVIRTFVVLDVGGPTGVAVASVAGEAFVAFVSAAILLIFASLLRAPRSRRQWLLLGTGVLAFAAGDMLFAILERITGQVPYPGLPDLFYVAGYVFAGTAVFYVGFSLRRGTEVQSAFLISGLACIVGLGTLFFGLIQPLLLPAGLGTLELGLSVLYPVFDVALLFTPTVFLLVIAFRTGDRRVIFPWGMVSIGALLFALSDSVFVWLEAYQGYAGGSIIDYGWMAAYVFLAVAGSLALDAESVPVRVPVPGEQINEDAERFAMRTSGESRATLGETVATRPGA